MLQILQLLNDCTDFGVAMYDKVESKGSSMNLFASY